MDDDGGESLDWIEVSREGFPFPLPKELQPGTWLLRTQQANGILNKLRGRKGRSGINENLIILSGPSGIGKSCLTLLVAAHMSMQENENVLYVPDAGELLAEAMREAQRRNLAITQVLVKLLLELSFEQNSTELMNKIFCDGKDSDISMDEFVEKLNENGFIIFIDEQGHAYTELKQINDNYSFGMIYPNFYVRRGNNLRVVLTGSNQASFEATLNGTYWPCLEFVLPMTDAEAIAFKKRSSLLLDEDDIRFYCNNVPREMMLLSKAVAEGWTRDSHMKNRAADMQQALAKAYVECGTPPSATSAMLTYFFRDKSLGHHGNILAPFLDLGFVYRARTVHGLIEAHPLCLSTETALIGLWKLVGLPAELSLEECIRDSNGVDFEALVFYTLSLRYSHEYRILPCCRLGYFGGVENYALKIDTVYISSLQNNALDIVASEIKTVHASARKHLLTILYKCPRGTESVDFCVLSVNGVIAIQVSLQSMTSHRPPNAKFLSEIGAGNSQHNTRGSQWRYIHVTASPEVHPIIALQKEWNGVAVNNIRLLDARAWLAKR